MTYANAFLQALYAPRELVEAVVEPVEPVGPFKVLPPNMKGQDLLIAIDEHTFVPASALAKRCRTMDASDYEVAAAFFEYSRRIPLVGPLGEPGPGGAVTVQCGGDERLSATPSQ